MIYFFFFKQKTAYEIYQCDWSSDVCSSDLNCGFFVRGSGIQGNPARLDKVVEVIDRYKPFGAVHARDVF